jgi:hypothetical protein
MAPLPLAQKEERAQCSRRRFKANRLDQPRRFGGPVAFIGPDVVDGDSRSAEAVQRAA